MPIVDLITCLRSADTSNARLFQPLLSEGLKQLKIKDADLAYEFGISIKSVNQWKLGLKTPHPVLVPHVLSKVADMLAERTL